MSSPGAHGDRRGSIRTCVGCRQRADKLELVRVVAQDRGAGLEVVPDPRGGAPGRGAHLHPSPACLGLALRRRAFARALRTEGSRLDTRGLEEFVHEHAASHDTRTTRSTTDQERQGSGAAAHEHSMRTSR